MLLQSFQDEFELPNDKFTTPVAPGSVLTAGNEEDHIDVHRQSKYRTGTGKLLHMMRWSRPNIFNAVQEISRFGGKATEAHYKQMLRTMKYCVDTKHRGLTLDPIGTWDGKDLGFEFKIVGISDSDYAKDKTTRRSVNGWLVTLNGSPVAFKSKMMTVVALSVTEAELFAATNCVQDMLYVMRLVESIGLTAWYLRLTTRERRI